MSGQSILRHLLLRIVGGFLVGALYAGAWYGSPASGGLAGALCAASFSSLEQFVLRRNAGGFIRPLPFLAYFALRSVLYVGVIVFVIEVVNAAAGAGFAGVRAFDLIVSLALAVGVILFLSVNDLLGPGVLFAFAAGRYIPPRTRSARSSSSTCALPPLSPSASANCVISACSTALSAMFHSPSLRQAVKFINMSARGDRDMALRRGANDPACVRAVFAALDRIAAQGPRMNVSLASFPTSAPRCTAARSRSASSGR